MVYVSPLFYQQPQKTSLEVQESLQWTVDSRLSTIYLIHPSFSCWRSFARPFGRLTCAGIDRNALLAGHKSFFFAGHVHQDRSEDYILAHVVKHNLVVGVQIGMPGLVEVVPRQGTQVEGWNTRCHKGHVVCSSSSWVARKLGLQVLGNVTRHLVEPAT